MATAAQNAKRNGVDIDFKKTDILTEAGTITEKFDIIVSNPPYIRESEKNEMASNVLDYEPHSALFVPDGQPLLFYEAIGQFAINSLNPGGMLFFEINQRLGEETKQMLTTLGFKQVELKKDFYQNDRMIRASI